MPHALMLVHVVLFESGAHIPHLPWKQNIKDCRELITSSATLRLLIVQPGPQAELQGKLR